MMYNKFFCIAFLLIISASACTQPSIEFNPNAGAVIEELSFDTQEVFDDEKTTLTFDVVNVGAKEIPKDGVNVYIYGPTIDNGPDVWTHTDPPGMTPSDGYISTTISSIDLPPPEPSLDIPGGRQSFVLMFDPPQVMDNIKELTEFHVGLCYPYSTKTLTQLDVTSRNELRAKGVESTKKDTINAAGPIHLSIIGKGNIRAGGTIPIVFKVVDVGGGFATLEDTECTVDQDTSYRNRVKVEVSVDGDTDIECTPSDGIVVIKDGEGTLYCTYTPSTTSGTPHHLYRVTATATYKYYISSTVVITNVGSPLP